MSSVVERSTNMNVFRKSLVLFVLVCTSAALAFAAADGNFDRTLKVTGAVDMEVSTGAGQITVKSGPAGALTIHGHVRVSENLLGGSQAPDKEDRIVAEPPIAQNGN